MTMLDFLKRVLDAEDKPQMQDVPAGVKSRIVKLMYSEYGFEPVPLAGMGILLKNSGIEPSDYGFEKLKPFLAACSDVVIVENNPRTNHPAAQINRDSDLCASVIGTNGHTHEPLQVARGVSAETKAKVASAIGEEHGYGKPVLLAQISKTLEKNGISYTDYGYGKLKGFLEACGDVLEVEPDGPGGHPTVMAKTSGGIHVASVDHDERLRKPRTQNKQASPEEVLYGKVLHIGVNPSGSDYGIVESGSGVKYLFYDRGVDGGLSVTDFKKGDAVAFTLYTNPKGRTYASRVRQCLESENRDRAIGVESTTIKQPQIQRVPDSVQKELYGPLVQRFGFPDEPYPLADFGSFLNEIFFDYTQYGFEKAKPFALGLDKILEVSYAEFGELVHPYFSLKRYQEWLDELPGEAISSRESKGGSGAPSSRNISAVAQVLEETGRPDNARSYNTEKQIPERLALAAFADFDHWNAALSQLSKCARPDTWSIRSSRNDKDLEILDNYLVYTFFRLKKEGKVLISDDELSAAFNTGLVDELYEDIFACFSKKSAQDDRWHFDGFCTQSSFSQPASCLDRFTPLPEPPFYFDNPENLVFNPGIKIRLNYDHIILQNIERLPISFLRNELFQFDEADGYLRQLDDLQSDGSKDANEALEEVYDNLTAFIESRPRCMRRLRERVQSAVESAEKRARLNYKTAIPVYYPRFDSISLLLPLDLTDDGTTDVALVIERNDDSRFYRGRTIYTLDMAYKNARLVCRLDNDWLIESLESERAV